ncbi:hypothetical protein JYU34_019724 [Plutella xylostella]|uniref:Major facilitator superfamily (MFS) profile domain-containing protein n=1 Tax=Plutella xylostella TaxID=51655 RepID=A0ABQ7PWP3_PLUXY|nr:facilitated trehalose transporter Tret1 [Plutella xylostella]KAG7296865.1 hypothetical protein JYU34_019724 [Plutella xylostella]
MPSPLFKQIFVVSGAAVNFVGHGCVHGFPSVLFTQLETDGGPVVLTDHDVSWIGSMIGVVSIVGNFLSPVLMSRFGRQKAHLCTTIPALIGWAIFLFANSVPLFLTSRVLHGLAIGIRLPLAAILVAEYTDPKYRGVFLGTFAVSLGLGIMLSHVIGMYLSWRMTALACGLFPLCSLIIISLSPESPSWLVSKGRFDEAAKAFNWLRGDAVEQQAELDAMITAHKNDIVNEERRKKETGSDIGGKSVISAFVNDIKHFIRIFKREEFYKPAIIAISMLFVFEFCGSHMVPAYGHIILQSVLDKKDPNDVNWQFTVVDLLRTVSAFVATYLLKRFKRRIVLFTSGVFTVVSMICLSAFIYVRQASVAADAWWQECVAMALMIAYTLSFSVGLVPLTWVICGEVFPLSFRSLGSTISTSFWMPAFVISMKSAPHLFSSVGVEGTFLVQAGTLTFCLLILYALFPETKDRTLQDIENSFKKNKGNDTDVEMRLMDK